MMNSIETRLLGAGKSDIAIAGELIRRGGTVIIPTETVYGLAANACDCDAVARIFRAKGRPQDNPLIVHVGSVADAAAVVRGRRLPRVALRLAEAFWPGPLTMILPRGECIPAVTAGGLDTVAVRLPAHPAARAVIAAAGVPVAAPSANRSGRPSPTCAAHCIDDMWGRVDAIVDGGSCVVGVESTVITLCGKTPRLLRPGAVTPEQLRRVIGALDIDEGVTGRISDDAEVSSPGMKYKHYSPKAEVVLVSGDTGQYARYLAQNRSSGELALCFEEELPLLDEPVQSYGRRADHSTQAAMLFGLLRALDKQGIKRAYVHTPDTDGVGLAVYNRLVRAAGFTVIDLSEGGKG